MNQDQEFESLPLRVASDNAILMHREVHFGGNFKIMLDYYENEEKGVCQDFEIDQIRNLANMENETKKNLAAFILTGAEIDKVARAKKVYQQLRDLYEDDTLPSQYPLLIADLILSEDEDPKDEIAAIAKEKSGIVPSL